VISTRGLSPLAAIALIDNKRDRFTAAVQADPIARREIAAFRDRIGTIGSVDALLKDQEVYSFAMKAFGMEKEIFAKAMMKRILTADPDDKKSLVNRLTDPRYREINKALGFETDGTVGRSDFGRTAWVDTLVDRYVSQRLIDGQMEQNPTVGIALDFERKAKGLTNWFKVLADPKMAGFMRTALGLPESVAQGSVDAQAKMFGQRMKIEDLQDPAIRKKLIRQYAAIEGALGAAETASPMLDLFTRRSDRGNWSPVLIDVGAVTSVSGAAYRTGR
jgi:hypothetical protein